MKRAAVILPLQLLAFWPVWRWYAARVTGSIDETWGLLALSTGVLFFWWKKSRPHETETNLLWPTLLVLTYALTYTLLPPLLRATLAFTAIACTISSLRLGTSFHPGALGLFYLSLPVTASLQFYGGYPLRVIVAGAAAPLLQLGGFAVIREGTCLNWGGQLIWVDAPCSGIRMLWAGLYLTCTLACFYQLRPLKTLFALTLASFAIIFGNVFRAIALFYIEAGIVEAPSWTHDYAGVVAFAIVAIGILIGVQWIGREEICDAQFSI